MEWWNERMLAFDTETTGPKPTQDRIVQFALVWCGGKEPTESEVGICNPGIPIQPEATEVHGITDAQAKQGRHVKDVVEMICAAVAEAVAAGVPLVVFNARFDLTVVQWESRRLGIKPPPWDLLRVVDPLVIDRHLDRFRRSYPYGMDPEKAKEDGIPSSRTLVGMSEHYRVPPIENAHDAAADALGAARLAHRIGKRAQVVRRVRHDGDAAELESLTSEWQRIRGDLGALHAAQIRWAETQAIGLEEYFAKQGKPEPVEREWPVILNPRSLPPDPEEEAIAADLQRPVG